MDPGATAAAPPLDAPRASRLPAWAGPVACGCALVGAALYVAAVDPTAPGSHLPACPLYELTGILCPGCGLTRATHAALRGDIAAALGYNVLLPLFAIAIIGGWVTWLRSSLGRRPLPWLTRVNPWASGGISAAVLIGFAVLRNLSPFSALAP